MQNLFPRKKPTKIKNIDVIPEYLVKGKLKKSYAKTKQAFNVPWMGVVAMAFSKYYNFYNALCKYTYPLSNSIQFNILCKKLVNISKKKH